MANLKLIQAVTVGSGGAAEIGFTSIPQTYTDLVLVVSARLSQTGGNFDGANLKINGSTSNFSFRLLNGNGSAASSTSDSTNRFLNVNIADSTANTFGNLQVYIPNYTSSNNKSIFAEAVTETNATSANIRMSAALWSNSAAITSLSFYNSDFSGSGAIVQYSTAYLYGITNVTTGSKATGGIVYYDSTYYYHVFPYSGTFTPTQSLTADYLVVAGGGGGYGGGGGAGGLRSTVGATGGGGSLESALSLTAQAYTVTIGAGGVGDIQDSNGTVRSVTSGSNSTFSTITSTGGGAASAGGNGSSGGSGGGGGGGATTTGGAGTANQGYAGGGGIEGVSNNRPTGGGGGAGAVGGTATSGIAGAGGSGVAISALAVPTQTGVNNYYAGGGGGGVGNLGVAGLGGAGGGGAGTITAGGTATSGTANTGGGGGGRSGTTPFGTAGNGGSGIVIIRYAI